MATRGGLKAAAMLATLTVVSLVSLEAWACPMCALNEKAGLGSWFILAGMIGTPFVVAGSAILIMRKIGAQAVSESHRDQESADGALALESSRQ